MAPTSPVSAILATSEAEGNLLNRLGMLLTGLESSLFALTTVVEATPPAPKTLAAPAAPERFVRSAWLTDGKVGTVTDVEDDDDDVEVVTVEGRLRFPSPSLFT